MARCPKLYSAPFSQQTVSLTPILPMAALDAIKNRLTTSVTLGTGVGDRCTLTLDTNSTLKLQFSDGSCITLPPSLFDIASVPIDTPPVRPHKQVLERPKSPPPVVLDCVRSVTQDTRAVQTNEADIPTGQGHRSPIFPAIEEMVRNIEDAERRSRNRRF